MASQVVGLVLVFLNVFDRGVVLLLLLFYSPKLTIFIMMDSLDLSGDMNQLQFVSSSLFLMDAIVPSSLDVIIRSF